MLSSDYKEELDDGKVLLYLRNGIFHARIYVGDRKYLRRTLKTSTLEVARKNALRLLHETEFKQQEGIPLSQHTMSQVIDEYVAFRQKQYDQSQLGKPKPTNNSNNKNSISIHMLRQIKRVVKFWREYCGNTAINKIDNAVLQGYISWRRDFYHRMPKEQMPKNAKLNPTDMTLQWEMTLGKTMIKFAHERGYRGNAQLPTFSFTGGRKIVRPSFTLAEYKLMYEEMRRWINEVDDDWQKHARLLLRDYALILSNSGMRVGEANNLQWGDVEKFTDEKGRENYRFYVRGKTGKRTVIPRTNAVRYIRRLEARTANKAADDYVFKMRGGGKVITLIDQFQHVLKRAGILTNRQGERYTLYSLRHFYADMMLRKPNIGVFDIARNMGTSVQVIMNYYGSHTTSMELATKLGG